MATNIKLGDVNQNSYVTATLANTYFGNRRDTTEWDNLSTVNKDVVLKQSAKDLDIFNYIDEKYYDNQGLQFPRDSHKVVTGNCGTPITPNSFRHTNLYSTTYMKYPTDYWLYGSVHITLGTALYDTRLVASSCVTTGSLTVTENFSATPTSNSKFIVFAPIDKNIQDAQCEQALFILKNSNAANLLSYRELGIETSRIGDVEVTFKKGVTNMIPISSETKKLLSSWIKRRYRVGRR